MKIYVIALMGVLALSCQQNGNQPSDGKDSTDKVAQSNEVGDTSWVNSFNLLRTAIYQGDKAAVKKFIDFPVMSENNEIWSIVAFDDPKVKSGAEGKIVPFEESDFDRHFKAFFPKEFITALLKVKAKDLYSSGTFETKEIKDTADEQYNAQRLFADVDRKEMTLTLNLNSGSTVKNEEGEDESFGESSLVYVFDILKNGQLKFKAIHFAG
jgi:hypothetical protein